MDIQALKNKVLQLAIEGKLVEQRPEEGTGQDLFNQILEERQKLIVEGKIKNEKALAPISDEELSFDIPDSWQWARMSMILDVRDGTHDSPKYISSGIPLVTSKNLSNGTIDFSNIKFISEDIANKINLRSNVDDGDILFAMIGTIGNPVLVKKERNFCIKNVALFKNFSQTLFTQYVYWFLCYVQYYLRKQASGGVQSFVSLNMLRNTLIPLPPLEEQKRIVAKIEKIFSVLDKLQRLFDENTNIKVQLKKKILQYAIEGKLVEQRPEEGTGQDLFNQIQEEKQKLIAEGKIKKEKALAPITEDEIPFDIPENWEWTRIGLVTSYNQTKEKVTSTNLCNDTLVLDLEDIEKESGIILEKKLAKDKIIKGEKLKFTKGDILYSKLRPYLKKILIAPSSGVCSSEIVPFSAYGCLSNTYVMYFMKSPLVDIIANENSYGVKMPRVSSETICNIPLPLPPLEEQKRIVAKVEELLKLCDKLDLS